MLNLQSVSLPSESPRLRWLPQSAPEWMAVLLALAALLFGGGPKGTGDAIVHVLSALAFGVAAWQTARNAAGTDATFFSRLVCGLFVLAALVMAAQLIPLPASFAAGNPQRTQVLSDLALAGITRDAWPLSLDRWGTVRSLAALMSTFAVFALARSLPVEGRLRTLRILGAATLLCALLGFSQAAAGVHAWRAWEQGNNSGATGFFANRNHYATLMAMWVPLSLALGIGARQARRASEAGFWFAAFVIFILSGALSFSRTGLALLLLTVAVSLPLLTLTFGRRGSLVARLVPLFAVLVAALGIYVYAAPGLLARLERDPLEDLRWQYLQYGLDTARAYWPWGSGLGSFPYVYAPFEPVTAMVNTVARRAHNDLLQTGIEAGLPGLIVLALWSVTVLVLVFRNAFPGKASATAASAASAAAAAAHHEGTASVVLRVSGLVLLVPFVHSLVDYPLRTFAVAGLFGLVLAIAVSPRKSH